MLDDGFGHHGSWHTNRWWGAGVPGWPMFNLFGTAFRRLSGGEVSSLASLYGKEEGLAQPSVGKLIVAMDDDLLLGVLTKRGQRPLAMVVNCRVSKGLRDLPDREVTVRFHPSVRSVRVLEPESIVRWPGSLLRLTLEPGGGQLLEMEGAALARLADLSAIY